MPNRDGKGPRDRSRRKVGRGLGNCKKAKVNKNKKKK